MAKDVAKKSKVVHHITRVVEVDDISSELAVKVDFNGKNGNFKVSGSITTKQVSFQNEDVNEAVQKQLSDMMGQGVGLAMQLKEQHSNEPETNQIALDF